MNKVPSPAIQIVENWLQQCVQTIQHYDHAAHMNLISKQIQVLGIPGFDVIGYDDWHAQCEHEFAQRLILEASYEGFEIHHENDSQIMFSTVESITAIDNTTDRHAIEIILSKESDQQWRVTQERLLDKAEAQ